jgi:tetratricopeptide (TPR) repeat protein
VTGQPTPGAPEAYGASVFISYVRRSSAHHAEAVHRLLQGLDVPVFLDTLQPASGEGIPEQVLEGLLAARVAVVFLERDYFTRRYCEEEWTVAIMAYRTLLRWGRTAGECVDALEPIVIARPAGAELSGEWERLPPELRVGNWPDAAEAESLVSLVRTRLERVGETIGERLERLGERAGLRERVYELMAIPEPQSLRGTRTYHESGLPPSIGEAFVGRARELWEVHSLLSSPQAGARTAAVTTALEGGGGFGKTRLALEYVHRYGPSEYPGGVLWVNAEVPEDRLEAQMHGILRLLRPGETPGLEAFRASKRDAARELGQALYGMEERALYVVDNVPETSGRGQPEQLSHWCPAVGGVTLLVTSRAHQSVIVGVERLELRELSTSSAVRLLTHDFVGRDELDDERWRSIAEWVGEWPLALELLNAALRESAITARELLALSGDDHPVSALDRQMDAVYGAVPEGVLRGATEAIGISYQRLPPEGRQAARLLGWLAPDPIPAALVTALGDDLMPPRVRVRLRARSLVSVVGGAGVEMYGRVHRVLADYLRGSADDAGHELRTMCEALTTVMAMPACRDPAQWPLMDACRPHAEVLFRRLVALPPRAQLAAGGVKLAVHVGVLLREQGQLESAALLLSAAVELAAGVLGERHPSTLWAEAELSGVLRLQGQLTRAHQLQERVLQASREVLGEEHNETLRAMATLAETLRIMGHRRRARRLQERALELRQSRFGLEHPETLWVMARLADTLRAQGDRTGAQRLQEEVLDSRSRVLGTEHPDTLRSMASLGVTLREQGELEAARKLHEEVLQARRQAMGEEHPGTFNAMATLAATVREQGELSSARHLEEAVLAWRRRVLGDEHPETLWAMSYLAETLRAQGELRDAATLAQGAVERWQRVFGETHPDTLWATGNLAETRRVSGNLGEAAELLEKVMDGRLEVLGEEHPDTLWTVTSLSAVKRAQGDVASAEALTARAEAMQRQQAATFSHGARDDS